MEIEKNPSFSYNWRNHQMNQNYYRSQYLINSSRWHRYDYTNNGLYFVTICVQNRKCHLGKVKNGIMGLSPIGVIVCKEWFKTEKIRRNVRLGEFIIMPNHLHGIIEITGNNTGETKNIGTDVETLRRNVSTDAGKKDVNWQMSQISPKSGSLSEIVRSFKSACTREIHQSGYKYFSWQPRFYDHVLKINADSLDKIRYYIKYNPRMWDKDKNNPGNIK